MYAIVKAGGRQHKVAEGEEIVIDRVDGKVGQALTLAPVLFVGGEKVKADAGDLSKVEVKASIVEQLRDDKVLVFKYKAKKNYHRTRGHRQHLTRVKIESIGAAGAKKAAKSEVEAPKAKVETPKAKSAAKPTKAKAAAKSEVKTPRFAKPKSEAKAPKAAKPAAKASKKAAKEAE